MRGASWLRGRPFSFPWHRRTWRCTRFVWAFWRRIPCGAPKIWGFPSRAWGFSWRWWPTCTGIRYLGVSVLGDGSSDDLIGWVSNNSLLGSSGNSGEHHQVLNVSLRIYINIDTYNLLTLVWSDSLHLFLLRWSTAIPMVFANWAFNPAFCNSKRLKPLARRSTVLYLWVCPLPTGLNLATGLGEVANHSLVSIPVASCLLCSCRLLLRAGWLNQVLTNLFQCFLKWTLGNMLLCLTISNDLTLF